MVWKQYTFSRKYISKFIFLSFLRLFIGKTDASILWPPDAKSQFIGKDPGVGKDWGQERKSAIEDEKVKYYHWLNGHESEQMPG